MLALGLAACVWALAAWDVARRHLGQQRAAQRHLGVQVEELLAEQAGLRARVAAAELSAAELAEYKAAVEVLTSRHNQMLEHLKRRK